MTKINKFCKDSSAGDETAKPTEDDSGKDEEAAATKIQAGFKGIIDLRIVFSRIHSKPVDDYHRIVFSFLWITGFDLIIVHFLSTESCL